MPRGSKPGEHRGGRKKGTKNRATLDVEAKLRGMGCDPILGMARIANAVDERGNSIDVSVDLRARMFAELAQYVAPKRKATEITGAGGGPVVVTWLPPSAK